MNGNNEPVGHVIATKSVKASDILRRTKPEMQKVTIRVGVTDEKGNNASGYKYEEWLVDVSVREIYKKVIEAIGKIE